MMKWRCSHRVLPFLRQRKQQGFREQNVRSIESYAGLPHDVPGPPAPKARKPLIHECIWSQRSSSSFHLFIFLRLVSIAAPMDRTSTLSPSCEDWPRPLILDWRTLQPECQTVVVSGNELTYMPAFYSAFQNCERFRGESPVICSKNTYLEPDLR